MMFAGVALDERRQRVRQALEKVGLTARADHRPDQLSGGEIVHLMEQMNQSGLTLLVVTHDPLIGGRACRRIQLSDGDVVADERLRPAPAPERSL